MIRLLYKEVLAQRTLILIYLAASIAYMTQVFKVNEPLWLILPLAIFFTSSNAALEDKNKSHILINSLPVSRKEVVAAKYLFNILFGIVLLGIGCIYQAAFSQSVPENSFLHIAFAVAGLIWFISFFFPMYYWLGPRFVKIGMISFFILMFAVVPMIYNLGMKRNFWGIVDYVLSSPAYLLNGLLFGITILILIVSWLLSVWLYERKEF